MHYFKILLFPLLFISLSGCDETQTKSLQATPPAQKTTSGNVPRFSSNSQLRATLVKIDRDCRAKYDNDRQGVGLITAVLGGAGGDLISSVAADAAKHQYAKCRTTYDKVAAVGRSQGFTADPRKEAAAAAKKRREEQAAAWRRAQQQAASRPAPRQSSTYCDSYCQDRNRIAQQDALAEQMHNAGWAGHD